jgi:predicted aspartyl protease
VDPNATFAAAACLAMAYCAHGGTVEARIEKSGYLDVPLAGGEAGQMRTAANFSGAPALVAIDTGWPYSSLEPALYDPLPSLEAMHRRLVDPAFGLVPRARIHIATAFQAGPVMFANTPFTRQSLPAGLDPRFHMIQGVLGYDFLARNHALIRCGRQKLYVRPEMPSQAVSGTLEDAMHADGMLKITLTSRAGLGQKRLICPVMIDGAQQQWVVDTGAYRTVVNINGVPAAMLTQAGERADEAVGVTGKTTQVTTLHARTVAIGGTDVGAPMVAVASLGAWSGEPDVAAPQGLLGMDILTRMDAWIDVEGGRLFVRPAEPVRRP